MADVADDADDLYWSIGKGWNPKRFADSVRRAEGVVREILVNDDDGFGAEAVLIGDESTFAQRELHDVDEAGRDAGGERERSVGGGRRGRGGIRERIFAFAHGDDVGERGGLDAGSIAHVVEDFLPGGTDCVGVRERRGREREARGENVVDVDAGIERGKMQQRAAEHSSGDEQDECKSDFGDDEHAVEAARASGDGAAAEAKSAFEIADGDAEGGSEAEEKTAGE